MKNRVRSESTYRVALQGRLYKLSRQSVDFNPKPCSCRYIRASDTMAGQLRVGIIVTIAHYLTFFRILVSPIFLLVYLEYDKLGLTPITLPYVLLGLLCVCELSDAFDGHFARKYNQVTDFGKLIDPMADSISRLSVFLTFTEYPVKLPMLLVFLFLYRDCIISTLRTICALRGVTLAARTSGKVKAIIQAIAAFIVVLLMIPHSKGEITTQTLHDVSTIVVAIAAAYSLFSAGEYIVANRRHIARLLTLRQKPTTL